MKKALIFVLTILVCATVFAGGWELEFKAVPYGFYVDTKDDVDVYTKYVYGFNGSVDYWFDNGFYVGTGASAGRISYDIQPAEKWDYFNLEAFGGHFFQIKDNFFISAEVGLGAEFGSLVEGTGDYTPFDGEPRNVTSLAVTAGISAEYFVCAKWGLTFGAEYEFDYNADETESGFCLTLGVQYEL